MTQGIGDFLELRLYFRCAVTDALEAAFAALVGRDRDGATVLEDGCEGLVWDLASFAEGTDILARVRPLEAAGAELTHAEIVYREIFPFREAAAPRP